MKFLSNMNSLMANEDQASSEGFATLFIYTGFLIKTKISDVDYDMKNKGFATLF